MQELFRIMKYIGMDNKIMNKAKLAIIELFIDYSDCHH